MKTNKILITGGTGRLAAELKKHLEGTYVGIENFDIRYVEEIQTNWDRYDLILHMAAYTDVVKAETQMEKCFETNTNGTFNLVQAYIDTPFVYISTEYANKPLGVYALSKRLGEEIVATHPHHLIIRTSFKPNPFPFPKAYADQFTQGDYVDVIAKLVAEVVNTWDGVSRLIYVGTGRKTMFELAKRTRPDVKPNRVEDYLYAHLIPHDYA